MAAIGLTSGESGFLSKYSDLQDKYNEIKGHEMPEGDEATFNHYHTASEGMMASTGADQIKYSKVLELMNTLVEQVGANTVPQEERGKYKLVLQHVSINYQRFCAKRDIIKALMAKITDANSKITRDPIPEAHLVTMEQLTPGSRANYEASVLERQTRLDALTADHTALNTKLDETRDLKQKIETVYKSVFNIAYYGLANPGMTSGLLPQRLWTETPIELATYTHTEELASLNEAIQTAFTAATAPAEDNSAPEAVTAVPLEGSAPSAAAPATVVDLPIVAETPARSAGQDREAVAPSSPTQASEVVVPTSPRQAPTAASDL